MTDYWDYVVNSLKDPLTNPLLAPVWALYDKAYDESHGADRYYLSKIPIFGHYRRFKDSAKEAQDQYENTGKDPAYSTRLNGPGFESLYGGALAGGAVAGMARSLDVMYTPEVVEDVTAKFNGSYR